MGQNGFLSGKWDDLLQEKRNFQRKWDVKEFL